MSDDTNLDNRLAQGRWESVHANDFARGQMHVADYALYTTD